MRLRCVNYVGAILCAVFKVMIFKADNRLLLSNYIQDGRRGVTDADWRTRGLSYSKIKLAVREMLVCL